jgi:hypothetical protein
MTGYSTAYQVACAPGPNAAATMTRGPGGGPVLMVYLDPVNMTIHPPASIAGARALADFCRELAHEATRLADLLDPDGQPAPPENSHARHYLARDEFGDTGPSH